jgi:hypothetical protein
MTRWRGRMGEERLTALLQESVADAVKTEAMHPADTRRVIVDTTVQTKNVMFPTDAKLIHRARERLVRLAKKTGVKLRQTYVRIKTSVSAEFPAPVHRRGSEGFCVHNGDCGHNDNGWRGKIRAASSGSGSWQR